MFKIIHTNDIHGHLENWPGIKQFITQRKLSYQTSEIPYLIMDIGDAIDAQHPMIEATHGRIMIELFNDIAYDSVTIGNNEGINILPQQLSELYANGSFDITIANLLDSNLCQTPDYAQLYHEYIIDEKKIFVIGLTAPYSTYHYNNYRVLSPIKTLKHLLAKMEMLNPDFIVLLSHLGLNEDRYIAQIFPQINLILGGHTHHLLPEGEWVNQTLLASCGRFGEYVGEVTVDYDKNHNRWNMTAKTFTIKSSYDSYRLIGQQQLRKKKLPMFTYPLEAEKLTGKQSFIQFALETIQSFASADVAVLNNGLFLGDLSAHETNEFELQKALPHPMHLVKLKMKGDELISVLNQLQAKKNELIDQPITGLGFRGEKFGHLILKNADYNRQWYVNGTEIRPAQQYTLVTVDHLIFLPFFTHLKDIENKELLFPELLREIIAWRLKSIERNHDDD